MGAREIIKIGVTTPSTSGLEVTVHLVQIVEEDLNEYVDTIGRDIKFDFIVRDNRGSDAKALENTQEFKNMGVDLIIGHGWSSHSHASLPYVNENDMLLLSHTSTSPILSIADDRFFRTCPNDFVQSPAIARMWKTWGAKAVLTIHRADAWGDGLWNILETEWPKVGIENLGRIRYAGEVTEFSSYLDNANDIVTAAIEKYGDAKYVGLQFFSFAETRTMQKQAADYPNLINVIWMTTEAGGRSQLMLDEAGEYAVQTRHFSPLMGVDEESSKFNEFAEKYYQLTGYRPGFYAATQYDACWLLAMAILETGSTDASVIADALIPLSSKFYGLTGWLTLDENGDRLPQSFDIWGFYKNKSTGEYLFRKWGKFDGRTMEVAWDDEALLTHAGITRPAIAGERV